MGPFAASALLLWAKGWHPIPLPPGAKHPPPEGFTGASGAEPSMADVYAWLEERGEGNVAIRLPDGVIGLDVDAYEGKRGLDTLAGCIDAWGELPPTWVSSSRPEPSGIRLYRVPPGLRWPGELGPGVEIIQRRHRYMIIEPSLHPSGHTYRWWHKGKQATVPVLHDLPWLPGSWVNGITGGEFTHDHPKISLSGDDVNIWIKSLRPAPLCRVTRSVLTSALTGAPDGSRHDEVTRQAMHLCHLGMEGHAGVPEAMARLGEDFIRRVTADGTRTLDVAEREWQRIDQGAVAIAATGGKPASVDPCDDPWWGILPSVRREANQEQDARAAPRSPRATGDAIGTRLTAVGQADTANRSTGHANDLEGARQVLIATEVERLRIRRAATRALDTEEHLARWREPPSWELSTYLDQAEDTVWTVHDLMPRGSNVVLTAQFKAGKTTLILNLARCLADGDPFLGRFVISSGEGRIALWNYEVSTSMFASWLSDARIQCVDRIVGLDIRGYSMPLYVERVAEWIIEWLSSRGVTHWILDPWGRAISGLEENSNAEVGKILDILDVIKERAGVDNLIIPAHTGRMAHEVGSERVRGATRLDDWADVRWILTQQDGVRYFRAHGRNVDVEEGALTYTPLTRALTFGEGSREPDPAPRPRPFARRERVETNPVEELLKHIGMHPGLSMSHLSRDLGRRKDEISRQLMLMEQQNLIKRSGVGRASGWYLPGHPDSG